MLIVCISIKKYSKNEKTIEKYIDLQCCYLLILFNGLRRNWRKDMKLLKIEVLYCYFAPLITKNL